MKKRKFQFIPILLGIFTGLSCLYAVVVYTNTMNRIVDQDRFRANAEVTVKEDWVGANVRLKQAIHGTDGIYYRYIVKTDCPSWDFETRYMSDKPISWANSDTDAVQVLIYDTQVRYHGTVYAGGQYYTIPLLDDLSSEDVPLEVWKENLVTQAYQTYLAEAKDTVRIFYAPAALILLSAGIWAIDRKRVSGTSVCP